MAKRKLTDARVIAEMVVRSVRSRRELGRALGLSKGAVTQVVNRLLKSNLIEEGSRFNDSRRGRKTAMLKVCPDLAYFLGANLEGMAVYVCLLDCENKVIASGKHTVNPQWSTAKIVRQWMSLIENIINSAGIKPRKIAGLGIGLPGVVSQDNFRTRAYLPPGRWVDLDIGKVLMGFGFPITAANNVICVSEYERKIGIAVGTNSFVSMLVRYGIGASIYLNGAFAVGHEITTGELGHMRVDIKGPMCVCGHRGCLEVFASGRTWPSGKLTTDRLLRRELTKRSRYLGIGLANLLKVFHSPVVIINGIYNDYEDIVKPILLETLEDELIGLKLNVPKIAFGEPAELKTSIGAAMRAAEMFFEGYLDNKIFR
jgi:predicted NBD/HSP70 family sugar kinase